MWRGRHVTCVRKEHSTSKKETLMAAPSASVQERPHVAPVHCCTGPR